MLGRVRAAWDALRGYAAAQDSRASAWAASGGSANSEVASGAATIARRAREAVRNDPYATLRAADLAQHPRRGDLLRWGSPRCGPSGSTRVSVMNWASTPSASRPTGRTPPCS